ncbi:MAG: hypothetical protein FWF46_02290 [Oscillospiraceae bacterium]|nr:hypothetical protein [Oscillospiraceae bacterium]
MNKKLNIILIIFLIIILLSIVFAIIDYNRAKKQQIPVFCIKLYTDMDGGTKEYIGLGYKVIAYHKLNGYNKIHFGSIFMKYDNTLTGGNEL